MKETPFTRAVDEVIKLKLKAADAYIEEIIEPLSDVGNPEKLIGKKYEDWMPADRQLLARVYGTQEPNPLSNLIFNKEYKKVKELEEEI